MAQHETLVEVGREIVQASPQMIVDLDVEADGYPYGISKKTRVERLAEKLRVSPARQERASLLSVGAISAFGEEFYVELKPSSNHFEKSNREFCEKHNLERERLIEEGTDIEEAMHNLDAWTRKVTEKHEKHRAVLSAFNASFDFAWVDAGMRESGIKSPYGIAGFCTKSMAMALRITEGYDWNKTAKSRLPADIIPPGDFTHNALEDARYQQQLHFAMVGKLAALQA